jgi:hypothetical protein
VKRKGESGDRVRVIREYSAMVGATDGNIIAAIITIQTPRNHPSVPRPVHGPASMPRICPAVHHQPMPASRKRTATSPRRTRAAAKAAARSPFESRRCATGPSGQADQEKSEVDRPVLPSYRMPKASIRERRASAIVRLDPAGWNMPSNRTG